MRVGVIPGNLLERVALAAGLLPAALTEGYAPAFGRALALAADIGVFDAIGPAGATAAEVAASCATDPRATEKLLNLLVTMRYLRHGAGRYRLGTEARRYLRADATNSIRDIVRMKLLEWRWIDGLDEFVRTGRPLDVHGTMSDEDWGSYQRGMRAQSTALAGLLARRLRLRAGATRMLDVGGSHGYFSVALCRRHPDLRAEVLDLPQAVEHARPLLEREGMGDRVTLRAGDALLDDFGASAYDLVLMVSFVHHFDDATNRQLAAKAARALRPGGSFVIVDLLRPEVPSGAAQMGSFYDLYFALTSQSGLWTLEQMRAWQEAAGLEPRKAVSVPFVRELGIQPADRPLA
jgi:SAM-dependent methyltransferase